MGFSLGNSKPGGDEKVSLEEVWKLECEEVEVK